MTLNLTEQMPAVTLGTLRLECSDFSLKTEMPVLRQTLCDGTLSETVLSDAKCTLQIAAVTYEGFAKTAALFAAQLAQTAYSFTCCGLQFSGMRILSLNCTAKHSGKMTEISAVLRGTVTEAEP